MDDACGMGFGEAFTDLQGDVDRHFERQLSCVLEQSAQALASEQLHDEVRAVGGTRAHVDDFDGARTLQEARGASFLFEPLVHRGIEQRLQREALAGANVLDLVDEAIAAAADETQHAIASVDDGARMKRRRVCLGLLGERIGHDDSTRDGSLDQLGCERYFRLHVA